MPRIGDWGVHDGGRHWIRWILPDPIVLSERNIVFVTRHCSSYYSRANSRADRGNLSGGSVV